MKVKKNTKDIWNTSKHLENENILIDGKHLASHQRLPQSIIHLQVQLKRNLLMC